MEFARAQAPSPSKTILGEQQNNIAMASADQPPQKKQKAVKTNARIVIAPSPVTVSATPVSKVDGLRLHTHQHTFGTFLPLFAILQLCDKVAQFLSFKKKCAQFCKRKKTLTHPTTYLTLVAPNN